MSRESYIVVIDIGSSYIRTIITQIFAEEKPRIIGVGSFPSEGIRRGSIVDIEEVTNSLKTSIQAAEKMAGVEIGEAFVSIGGNHLKYFETKGVIAIGRADGEVTEDDVYRVIEASQAINIPGNYELLHIIPQSFSLDSQDDIKDPIGMNGVRLEMKGILIIGFSPHIKNISKCFSSLGISISGFVVAPLAAAKAVLNKRQRELGVMALDIGGGTTSMAVYEERELIHLAIIPVGSAHITNDIAIGLRTSIEVAEKVKIELGSVLPHEIDNKEQINLSEIDKHEEGIVSRKHVAEIIEARLEEILFLVEKELKKINKSALLPAGAVLVGGGAKLQGTVDLTKNTLGLPAQIGFPQELSGLVDKVDDPSFAVSIGMILWLLEESDSQEMISSRHNKGISKSRGSNILGKIPVKETIQEIKTWFGKFLP
jgi:cell division protein FtsA